MSQNNASKEALEYQSQEALNKQNAEPTPYVERPKSHRVLAWILAGAVIVGVLLYMGWIAGILH